MHTTLRNRISDNVELTQKERGSFVAMIGKGCRAKNAKAYARTVRNGMRLSIARQWR